MKFKIAFINCIMIFVFSFAFAQQENIVTYDIDNFWKAYDKITATKDSAQQYAIINEMFISKGSPGLKAIMQVRDYTDRSYIQAINNYPLFWQSIRPNTLRAKSLASEIEKGVQKLKTIYPATKPAKVYFTIGALRTGGTTLDSMVLIGCEIGLADKTTVTKEFPANMGHLRPYFDTDPIRNIHFNNVHEYVHTQQKITICDNLLGQCVMEGVAEFVAVKATGKASTTPSFTYGKANEEKVRNKFATQLYNAFTGFWLYSNGENEFGQRDLGYYVGYAICERYYAKAKDKKQAVKEMIQLDYNNEAALEDLVNRSGYFSKTLKELKAAYEQSRPVVTGIREFENNNKNVSSSITTISFDFSEKMDKAFRNFEFGPLGESAVLRFANFRGFAEDGKSISFDIKLEPGKQYQIVLGPGFRTESGISLQPYLVDFRTADK